MDTDYTSYSIVYMCDESYMASLWLLSRTPTMTDDQINAAKATVTSRLPNWNMDNWAFDVQGDPKCKYPDSISDEWELDISLI